MFTRKLTAVLLSVIILLSIAGCGEKPSGGETADAVQRQAVISQLSGEARILRGDGSSEKAAKGSVLVSGDSVLTESGAVATLSLDDDKTLTVSPSSEIMFSTLTEDGGTKTVILVKRGSLANSVDQKLEAGDIYEVCTGDMTMAIRGTDAYLEATPNGTAVSLLTGYALSFNYTTGKVYIVPAGVSALFPPNAEPSFELIDPEAFAESSEAAAAMLKKVEKENKNYKKDFETKLRESYIDSSGYSFSISAPMAGAVPSAEITTTQAVTTTATTTSTSAAPETKTAAPTAKTTVKPTTTTAATTVKPTAKPVTTTKPTTASSTAPTQPTAPTTASTTAPTQPTAPTTASTTAPTQPTTPTTAPTQPTTPTTAPTQPTAPTTASTTAPTQPTAPTTASTTAPTQPTAPTTASTTAPTQPTEPTTAPTQPTEPTAAPTQPTEPTTAPTQPTASTTATTQPTEAIAPTSLDTVFYNVVLTGLYYQAKDSSEWIPLTTGQIWSGQMELGSSANVSYTVNGQTFSFWVQCSEQMASPYDYPYFSSSYPSEYQSVKTFASATLIS